MKNQMQRWWPRLLHEVHFLAMALVAIFVGPLRLQAQTPLWKVTNTELRDDDKQLMVTFERGSLDKSSRNDNHVRKILVLIQNDGALLSYQPSRALESEKLVVDLANPGGTKGLKKLLADFRKANKVQKQRAASHLLVLGDEGQEIHSFRGPSGDFEVVYEIEKDLPETGAYGGYIKLISKDGDNKKYRAIVEPTALEQVLSSVDKLHQMHQEAIQAKQKRLAVQKALDEEKAKDEIASAKAAADERVKKARAAADADLAKLNHQKQLDAIGEEATAKETEITNSVLRTKRDKVGVYLSSQEGASLVKTIQAKLKAIAAKNADETADIRQLEQEQQEYRRIMTNPDPLVDSLARESAGKHYASLVLRISEAASNRRDSPELGQMRKELKDLGDEFKADCGLSYDEAMALQNTHEQSQVQDNKPAENIPGTLPKTMRMGQENKDFCFREWRGLQEFIAQLQQSTERFVRGKSLLEISEEDAKKMRNQLDQELRTLRAQFASANRLWDIPLGTEIKVTKFYDKERNEIVPVWNEPQKAFSTPDGNQVLCRW